MNSLTKVAAEAPSRRSFRVTLREMTREDHDASERFFAPFMDAPQAYMAPFLAAQHAALSAIRDAIIGITAGDAEAAEYGEPETEHERHRRRE